MLILDQGYCLRRRERKYRSRLSSVAGSSLPLSELLGIALFAPDIQKREPVLNISNHTHKRGLVGNSSHPSGWGQGFTGQTALWDPQEWRRLQGNEDCPPKRLQIFRTGQFKFSSFQRHCSLGHLQILAQLILITFSSTKCRADINHCMLILSHYNNYSDWLAYVGWIAKYFDSNSREMCSVQIIHVS